MTLIMIFQDLYTSEKTKSLKKKKKKMAGKTFRSTTLKTMVRANVDDNSDPDENLFLFVFFN